MGKLDLYQDKTTSLNTISDSDKIAVFNDSTTPPTRDLVDATVLNSYFSVGGTAGIDGRNPFRGAWASAGNYQTGDIVERHGVLYYRSGGDSSSTTAPPSSGWTSMRGGQGPQGDPGTAGVSGVPGSPGVDGRNPFRGAWDAGASYETGDIVSHNNVVYWRSGSNITGDVNNAAPNSDNDWSTLGNAQPTSKPAPDHYVAWGGSYNPLTSSTFTDDLLNYRIITPAGATGLGFESVGSRVIIGTHDHKRGQIYWQDTAGIVDPRRALLQFTITAAAQTYHYFVIGMATNDPEQLSGDTTNRGWQLFDRGIVLVYCPNDTSIGGDSALYLMSAQDGGPDGSNAYWGANTARADAGEWWAADGISGVHVSHSNTNHKNNAGLGLNASFNLHATNRVGWSFETFDRDLRFYIDGTLIATWFWDPSYYPFRSARPEGNNYLVRSTAHTQRTIDGASVSPITYVHEFGLSPASSRAPGGGKRRFV